MIKIYSLMSTESINAWTVMWQEDGSLLDRLLEHASWFSETRFG